MYYQIKNILVALLVFIGLQLKASNAEIDSLSQLLDSTDVLTEKIALQCKISERYTEIGEFEIGGKLANEALIVASEIEDEKGTALSYYALSRLHQYIGDWNKALTYHYKAIPIFEKIDAKENLGWSLLNMGICFHAQKNYPKAIEYDEKALDIFKEIDLKKGIAYSYLNISLAINDNGSPDSALIAMRNAREICEEIGDKRGVGYVLNSMAEIYEEMGEYDKAIQANKECIIIREQENDKMDLSWCYSSLGNIYLKKGNPGEAERNLILGEKLAKEINSMVVLRGIYLTWSQIDSMNKNYEGAYRKFQQYSDFNNLLSKEEKQRKAEEIQYNFEKIKKEQEIVQLQGEAELENILNEEKRQRLIIGVVALVVVLVVVVFFSVSVYKRAGQLRKQRNIITQQKERVDVQHKNIRDSIVYARKIQHALLTSEEYIQDHLKLDFFIHYQPKDIVSGDFYWAHEHNGAFYLTTADCTGHGVPGAFMSLLNISIMNELIVERNVSSPAEVLNQQKTQIIKSLNYGSSDGSKDGMDCVLCKFDLNTNTLEFASANNPLWIIRNGEIIKYKGDKMPVGKFINDGKFTDQKVSLEKGDLIYTFTDGFVDQFGGKFDKKFKPRRLAELLLKVHELPMEEQKLIVMRTLDEWMGSQEQTDDILMIGIRY